MMAAYIVLEFASLFVVFAMAAIASEYRRLRRPERAIGCGVFGAVALVIAVLCLWEVL